MGDYTRIQYHDGIAPWRELGHRPAGQLAGIELEVVHHDGFRRILRDLPDPTKPEDKPFTEEDSSLPDATGVEIVFPPFKYSTIKNGNSFFSKAIRSLNAGGAGPGRHGGMHVNINTTGWDNSKRMLVVALVTGFNSYQLRAIGGRLPNQYCEYPFWEDNETNSTINIVAVYRRSRFSHTIVCAHDNRLEFRFPRATTDINKIRLVIDFANYIEKFADHLIRLGRNNVDTPVTEAVGGSVGVKFVGYLRTLKQTAPVRRLIKEIENAR